jgi:hypothetical protein
MSRERVMSILAVRGGDQMRAKILRILYSGAALATLLMAAGAKWKVN